jgi:hypothetical protein
MKYRIVPTKETIATQGGNILLGSLLEKTALPKRLNIISNGVIPSEGGISTGDVSRTYIGMLCQAQPEFEAAEQFRDDPYFRESLGIRNVPSCSTLRQRLDGLGEKRKAETITAVINEGCRILRAMGVQITPCFGNHVALDIDVTPFDNSGTKKEGVSWTYKRFNGFAPIMAYMGEEGYCANVELREGSQHCQKGTPEFLRQSILNVKIATDSPVLVRMDSGNDAADNVAVMQDAKTHADFIIKRNPRGESPYVHFVIAQREGVEIPDQREGKRVFIYEKRRQLPGCLAETREVNFVIERTSSADGQILLFPEYELESYCVSLEKATAEEIQSLYHAHGTSEQFHSEIKTDMNLERLPSGKFATNAIVLAFGAFAYNLLRMIGQESLKKKDYPPTKHHVKRRRIRTVIDRYITLAVKFVRHARSAFVKVSEINPWFPSFRRIYAAFAA